MTTKSTNDKLTFSLHKCAFLLQVIISCVNLFVAFFYSDFLFYSICFYFTNNCHILATNNYVPVPSHPDLINSDFIWRRLCVSIIVINFFLVLFLILHVSSIHQHQPNCDSVRPTNNQPSLSCRWNHLNFCINSTLCVVFHPTPLFG